jgi:uncharacterized protein (TIGR04255 family)
MGRDLNEKFPRPPVKEVAFEIRFAPDLRIPNEIYRYQELIRKDLPRVGKVTEFTFGAGGAFPGFTAGPWVFEDNDENFQVKVAVNSLAILSRKHKSFEKFEPQAKWLTTTFVDTYKISAIERVGLRYINDIPLGEDPASDLRTYFVSPIDTKRFRYEDLIGMTLELRRRKSARFVTLRVSFQSDKQTGHRYGIDIDSYHEGSPIPTQDLFTIVGELHRNILQEFHDNITEAFVERLRKGNT